MVRQYTAPRLRPSLRPSRVGGTTYVEGCKHEVLMLTNHNCLRRCMETKSWSSMCSFVCPSMYPLHVYFPVSNVPPCSPSLFSLRVLPRYSPFLSAYLPSYFEAKRIVGLTAACLPFPCVCHLDGVSPRWCVPSMVCPLDGVSPHGVSPRWCVPSMVCPLRICVRAPRAYIISIRVSFSICPSICPLVSLPVSLRVSLHVSLLVSLLASLLVFLRVSLHVSVRESVRAGAAR